MCLKIKPWGSADLFVVLDTLSRKHLFADHFHLTHEVAVNSACLNDKELAAVCARPAFAIESAPLRLCNPRSNSSSNEPPHTLAAPSSSCRVTALNHKVVDNTVKNNSLIVAVFGMCCKVFSTVFGHSFGKSLNLIVPLFVFIIAIMSPFVGMESCEAIIYSSDLFNGIIIAFHSFNCKMLRF